MARTATTYPDWIGNPQLVDLVVARLLDDADQDEAAAATQGRPRSAAAQIRQLRHIARQTAVHGTANALSDAPTDIPVHQLHERRDSDEGRVA